MYLIHRMTKGALILTMAGGMAAVTFAEDAKTISKQEKSQIKMESTAQSQQQQQQQQQRQLMMVGDIADQPVKNRQGQELGHLEQFVLSQDRSRVLYAVLVTGGAMGVGGTSHAVPFAAFEITPGSGQEQNAQIVLDLPQNTFENRQGIGETLPEQASEDLVPQSRRDELDQQRREAQSDGNIFQQTGRAIESGARATGEALRKGAHKTGEVIESAGEGLQDMTDRDVDRATGDTTATTTTQTEVDTTRRTTTTSQQNQQQQGQQNMHWARQTDDLDGADVKNLADQELGETEDLVIDVNSGRVVYAVLAYGGTLGMNQSRALVPWASLELAPGEQDKLQIDINQAELNRLAWNGEGEIDVNDQQYVSRVQNQFQDVNWQVYGYDKDEMQKAQKQSQKSQQQKDDLEVKTKVKTEVERK